MFSAIFFKVGGAEAPQPPASAAYAVVSNIRFLWEIPEYYEQYLQLGIHQIPHGQIAFDSGLLWDTRLFNKIR